MVEAAFEPGDQDGEIVVQLASAIEGVCELLVVELAGLQSAGAVAVDLALDQLAEGRSDRLVGGEGAEVGPDVVGHLNAGIRSR